MDTPLRLRVVPRDGLPTPPSKPLAVVGPARERVARDLAADVTDLLGSPARLTGRWGDRALAPGDVAVLVRTNHQGTLVRDALQAAGVPAVVSGTASVFGTTAARDWLVLLEALERPRAARVRAVALTAFCGRTAAQLCGPDGDALVDQTGAALRSWASTLHTHGVAALLEAVTTGTDLPARLLATAGGERLLTDLRHVGEALHTAAVDGHLGPAALHEWLRHRVADAARDTVAERSRRLESDAAAVQIITVHRSKGLEFPVVYVPFGWDRNVHDPEVPLLHDDTGQRVLDVGGPDGTGYRERLRRHRAEEAGEDLRLLYVAFTRACCQVITWWVPATTTGASPLHRLLFGRPTPGSEVRTTLPVPSDASALSALRGLASAELAVEVAADREPGRYAPTPEDSRTLEASTLERVPDPTWRRTSYSALTAAAHGAHAEPEHPGIDDEAEVSVTAAAAVAPLASPMADLPVGAAFGTLVHAVLETADLTAPDLVAELTAHTREHLERRPVPGVEAGLLATALAPAVQTPLGPLAGGLRLRDVAPRDRLAELEFELPLAGGDAPRAGAATLTPLAALLRRHLPADDPLAGYPAVLETLDGPPLRGYLTGSIDAVVRLPGGAYAVVDHKTNWLGPIGPEGPEPLTAAHYAPPRLAEAMIAAHYPLQALIYAVALHRYLRWRLRDYDPEHHLGGAFYLFLRGMCGPSTPLVGGTPCGVFAWRPPPALVVAASTLLEVGA